jgi:hypothetical protein
MAHRMSSPFTVFRFSRLHLSLALQVCADWQGLVRPAFDTAAVTLCTTEIQISMLIQCNLAAIEWDFAYSFIQRGILMSKYCECCQRMIPTF